MKRKLNIECFRRRNFVALRLNDGVDQVILTLADIFWRLNYLQQPRFHERKKSNMTRRVIRY